MFASPCPDRQPKMPMNEPKSSREILTSSPLDRTVRLHRQGMAGQVADELRRRILSGELAEGVQLLQEQLASEFGISKVPVREALHQLAAEGFVVQEFHRGATVAGLSPDEVMEVFELRTQIEVWLLGLGMAAATAVDVLNAQKIARMIDELKDPVGFPDLNWRFHEALYLPAGKPFVLDYLKRLHSQSQRYVRMQLSPALDKDEVIHGHAEILELYARKDPAALDRLRKHILGFAEQLTAYLTKVNEERVARAKR